jgi:transposase
MRIIGCDLHAAQQTIAMLDRETGEITERTLTHEGTTEREFYAGLPPPVVVGIEATGSMGWFLRLMDELGVTCCVGDPARVRKVETRRQRHDRRDAALLLELLTEDRFPAIWMPPSELCDLRALLRHRNSSRAFLITFLRKSRDEDLVNSHFGRFPRQSCRFRLHSRHRNTTHLLVDAARSDQK